ncbi:unnamed protein product [Caenorhabditis brenneri]
MLAESKKSRMREINASPSSTTSSAPVPTKSMPQVTNNFGYNFEAFVEVSNDLGMKKWCAGYVKNQSDPEFMQQQKDKFSQLHFSLNCT